MPTDDDRREVARRLRELRLDPWDDAACEIAQCAGIACCNSECHGSNETPECTMALASRLADLIEPSDPTGRGVDSIYDWCRWRLEGADGAEDELYCSIMRAIEDYRHPERATAHTVRAVDREALLALADECDSVHMHKVARRIREALGVES